MLFGDLKFMIFLAGINFNWFVFICIWVECCWNMHTRCFLYILFNWGEYCWNMSAGINLNLFQASDLNITEICLQESILLYFIHLSWILLKYDSMSHFKQFCASELNICEICLRESILSNFMHLTWILLIYAFRNQFQAILWIQAQYCWNMFLGINFK